MTVLRENPYTWDGSSADISSPVTSLKLVDQNKKEIPIKDLPPIDEFKIVHPTNKEAVRVR